MIESRASVGASRYEEAQSVQECLDQCVKQPRCVAADVDLNIHPPTCWLHFNLSALSNIYSQPGINQYRLTDRHADGPITGFGFQFVTFRIWVGGGSWIY